MFIVKQFVVYDFNLVHCTPNTVILILDLNVPSESDEIHCFSIMFIEGHLYARI